MAEGVAIPEEFLCPISRDVMREPVWLDTGITVDRAFAAYYLQAGFRTCPVTGESILSTRLIPVRTTALENSLSRHHIFVERWNLSMPYTSWADCSVIGQRGIGMVLGSVPGYHTLMNSGQRP